MEETERQISKYNSGIAQLYRLDELWKKVNQTSVSGMFSKWNSYLDRIWCELSRDLEKKEYNIKKIKFDKFDEDISNNGNFNDEGKQGFESLTQKDISNRNKHYKTLIEKELFLRRLENELGKGTAFSDDEDDDFD